MRHFGEIGKQSEQAFRRPLRRRNAVREPALGAGEEGGAPLMVKEVFDHVRRIATQVGSIIVKES